MHRHTTAIIDGEKRRKSNGKKKIEKGCAVDAVVEKKGRLVKLKCLSTGVPTSPIPPPVASASLMSVAWGIGMFYAQSRLEGRESVISRDWRRRLGRIVLT